MLIRKLNEEQQIVTGEVYAPDVLDSHGDMMTAQEIEKMAYKFMTIALAKSIDAMHDNVPKDAYPVESFIARASDTDFTPGAWVLSVKVVDPDLWAEVKKGNINGYSFEAYVHKSNKVVAIETTPFVVAMTEPDPTDGHVHFFALRIDDDGKIAEGKTSTDKGHSHVIRRGTATEPALNGGIEHSHRIFT